MLWTSEKISLLSLQDVKSLASNARTKGRLDVVALCEAELDSRKKSSKVAFTLPDGFVKIERSAYGKSLEKDVCDHLVSVANDLSAKYDLSTEKARSLSVGTTRFIPHRLLDSKGKAKTGGAQKAGRVVFDRYISYRLRSDVYALIGILLNEDDGVGVRYQVIGPASILTNFKPLNEIRPYLLDGEKIGITSGGEEYLNFAEAASRFTWMIEQVAPVK